MDKMTSAAKHPRNLHKSHARCLCGLRATIHFTVDNRKLTCEEARELHARASVKPLSFTDALKASIEKAVRS